ncbi:MAG: hypothetical protein QOE70_830 [Chthoniobacter sp.]|jgi:hypothetical protein|nr:hypothetical protein [Chthoniobacter sp.]
MHPSNLVAILARLLALKVLMDGIAVLFSLLGRSKAHSWAAATFVLVGLYFLCAGALWSCALWLGRVLTKGCDPKLDTGALTLIDLYSVAFVCVGLYYAVDSFGFTLTWLHFALTQSSSDAGLSPKQKENFYSLFQCSSSLFIGLILVLRARRLSARLLKYDNQGA